MRGLLAPPRPWHVMLAPAVPLLALLGSNVGVSPPEVIVWPLIIAMAGGVLLWLLLAPMAVDRHRAALAASILTLLAMSHGMLLQVSGLFGTRLIVPLLYIGAVVVSIRMLRTGRPAAAATAFANRAFVIAVLLIAAPIVWGEAVRARTLVAPLEFSREQRTERPDVYVLVLDGYAREDVLRDLYRFENRLVPDLRELGFFVAEHGAANYAQTALSLASALNGEYLPALGLPENPHIETRRGLADMIRASRFFTAFADAGYHISAYSSEYAMLRPAQAHERPAPFGHLDEFGYGAVEASVLPMLSQSVGLTRGWLSASLHRRHLGWTLDHLASNGPGEESRPESGRRSADGGRLTPTLVFAHLLAPHPPFVFDAEGGPRRSRIPALLNDGNHWRVIAGQTGEDYVSGYVDAVRFLNSRVSSTVEAIVKRRGRPAIFLIHGDHGPGSRLKWDSPVETDMRERLGILLALRFPDGEVPPVGARTTLVNAYRAVLNRALGAALPPLEDRAFFSTWMEPFAYIDVTERLSCDGCN